VNFAASVNLSRIWKLPVTLAHKKVKLREQEKRNSFSWVPEFLIVLLTQKSHARKNRKAEIASPASDPRSLRRHYPHQVQGVVQSDLSAIAAPPPLIHSESKARVQQVNNRCARIVGEQY
jgi:hypothetical protein